MKSLSTPANALDLATLAMLANYVPLINPPTYLTASYTVTNADAGKTFVYNGSGTATLTFPNTLPDGFTCRVANAGLGTFNFDASTYGAHFGNAQRTGLIFQWDVVDIEIYTALATKIFQTTYNLALPVLYGVNAAAFTRNVTALSSFGISIPLEVGGAYDIDLIVTFASPITTNTLRLGLAALPTGANCQLEGRVFNSNAGGTATAWHKSMISSAEAVAGCTANAAVVGALTIARITGRIIMGTTAGSLVPTAGALATTGAVTVAAGSATLSVSKVFDLGRT